MYRLVQSIFSGLWLTEFTRVNITEKIKNENQFWKIDFFCHIGAQMIDNDPTTCGDKRHSLYNFKYTLFMQTIPAFEK